MATKEMLPAISDQRPRRLITQPAKPSLLSRATRMLGVAPHAPGKQDQEMPSLVDQSVRGSDLSVKTQRSSIALNQFTPEVRAKVAVFDSDKDGSIDPVELINAANMYARKKKGKDTARRGVIVLALVTILLSASTFVSAFLAAEAAKDTSVDSSGHLTIKGTDDPVEVAQSQIPSQLNSYLPDSAFVQLRYFEATSNIGALIRLEVISFMRLPAQHCLPPIVKLVTPVGSVHIGGSTLEFSAHDVNPFFLEAGFLTQQVGIARRRLKDASLMGFFNTLRDISLVANITGACLPRLPKEPWNLKAMSMERELCGNSCKYQHEPDFDIPNLVGVESLQGQLFMRSVHSTAMSSRVVAADLPNLTQTLTIKTYPRYPTLFVHSLDNSTHTARWVEYQGLKFHCAISNKSATSTDMDPTRGFSTVNISDFYPDVRYEGFTYFSSDRFLDVPALMYVMTWPSLNLQQHYFASLHDPDVPLGLHIYSLNDNTGQYEIIHQSDFWDVKINHGLSMQAFDTPTDCISPDGGISTPPDPELEPVGVGLITSPTDTTPWGDILPPLPPLVEAEVNSSNTSVHLDVVGRRSLGWQSRLPSCQSNTNFLRGTFKLQYDMCNGNRAFSFEAQGKWLLFRFGGSIQASLSPTMSFSGSIWASTTLKDALNTVLILPPQLKQKLPNPTLRAQARAETINDLFYNCAGGANWVRIDGNTLGVTLSVAANVEKWGLGARASGKIYIRRTPLPFSSTSLEPELYYSAEIEAAYKIPMYNWGRWNSWRKRLLPWRSKESCSSKIYNIGKNGNNMMFQKL